MLNANLKSILASGSREEDCLSYLLYIYIYQNLYNIMSSWGGTICHPGNFTCANLNRLVPRMLHTNPAFGPVVCERNIFSDTQNFP